MSDDPTNAAIEATLRAAPPERWRDLWAAVDELAGHSEHVRWGGGEQVDTTVVEGVERPVVTVPYAVYSDAVHRTIQSLYALGAVVAFDWPAWEGVDRYRGDRELDAATVAHAVRMVTAIIRADRFCEGTIAATLDDGTFLAALRRLRRWYEDERVLP